MLKEYRKLRSKIARLNSQIEEQEEMAQSLGGWPDNDRVQSSHEPDKIGAAVARLSDLKDERCDKILEAVDQMEQIEALLNNLQNSDHALVLQYYYIRGLTWEQVGEKMNYCSQWVQRLKNRALCELDKMLEQEEKDNGQ